MRNMKLRLISAALATCMMASVLPASAFAIEPADATTGTVANGQPETTTQLKSGDTINSAGTYTMSGEYSQAVTVNTTGDVTIEITGDVQLASGRLLNVESVGTLTIKGNVYTIETTAEQATEILHISSDMPGKVIVEGGTYKNEKGALGDEVHPAGMPFYFEGGTVTLNNVTAIANGRILQNWHANVTINGGNYTTVKPSYSTLYNTSVYGSLTLNEVTATTEGGNVVANYGQATINGGTYISKSASMAINAGTPTAGDSIKTYIHGGTFEGTGTVINNRGLMVIDEQVCETVIRVTETQGTSRRAGVRTQEGGNTTIEKATIENAEYGIWNRIADKNDTQNTSVTVGDVTFENTEKDIHLAEGKNVTINDNLTGTVNISWEGENAASIITSDSTFSEDLKLISANEDYVMAPDESGVFSAQKRAEDNYLVDTENATATADLGSGTQTLYYYTQVPEGTKVTLTADEDPVGQHFDHWELLQDDEDMTAELLGEFSEEDRKEKTVSFAVPKYDLTAKAVFASDSVPAADTEDDSWDAATVVTGVAIGAGAAVLTYHIGTELYAEQVLGKGVSVPKTREDVALKAWELAGKPAVELSGEPLSEAAQAEKWAVESGLMQNVDGSFNGAKKMNKLKALRVLDKAQKLG